VEGAGLWPFEEREEDAGILAGDAGVIGHERRADVGDELAVESVGAPERFVVDEEGFHRRAVRHPLGDLVARPR
jgi:hypothetical protein